MSDISTRRRMAGRGLLVAAALAIPTTASITYAEEIAAIVPSAPPVPVAPLAPIVPGAPAAPLAPGAPVALGLQASGEVEVEAEVEKEFEKKVTIIHRQDDEAEDGKKNVKIVRKIHTHHAGAEMSEEQIEEIMAEVHEGLAEADIAIEEAHVALLEFKHEKGDGPHTVVEMKCEGDDVATNKVREDGTNVVMICQSKIMGHALTGLKEARSEIAKSSDLSKKLRDQILQELDQKIASWDKLDS